MRLFRVRLNCIDHYQSVPTRYDPQLRSDTRPSQIANGGGKVPVIRVFGSTESGQKVCAHIHGAFPYLYIEYTGSLDPDEVGAYIYRLHLSIDYALAVSYRRDQQGENAKFVARITLVKGIPFYGFHVGYRFFLKIYMLNPAVMTRLADLLQQGVVMSCKFQPYEAHLQYLLQFMADYNLYGCGYIDCGRVKFRAPVPACSDRRHLWHDESIPSENITNDISLRRVSHCALEVDFHVEDIINRRMVQERRLHHDFVERSDPLPADLKLVYSMAGLWRDEARRRRKNMPDATPDSNPFPPEALVSMSADPRNSQPFKWLQEDEYREHIRQLIAEEVAAVDGDEPTFDDFVADEVDAQSVRTLLESVEDLFPANLLPALGLAPGVDPSSSIDVDKEAVIQAFRGSEEPCPEDLGSGANPKRASRKKGVDKKTGVAPKSFADATPSGTLPTDVQPTVNGLAAHFAQSFADMTNPRTGSTRESTSDVDSTPAAPELMPIPNVEGACIDRSPAGHPGLLPFHSGLFDVIRGSDLSSMPGDLSHRTKRLLRPSKRLASPESRATQSPKRKKTAPSLKAIPLSAPPILDPQRAATPGNRKSEQEGPLSLDHGGKRPPKSSSTTSHAMNTLNFPIVKDQNDPNTILRRSQKTRSYGTSDDGPPKNHVSFEGQALGSTAQKSSSSRLVLLPLQTSVRITAASRPKMERTTLGKTFAIKKPAPLAAMVVSTLLSYHQPSAIYQDAYYSEEKDVPRRPREYAGREFRLKGSSLLYLPEFDTSDLLEVVADVELSQHEHRHRELQQSCSFRSWELTQPPPTSKKVKEWFKKRQAARRRREDQARHSTQMDKKRQSQIHGPEVGNKNGFKNSPVKKSTSVQHEAQYMSIMSLEVHVNTRGKLMPNPEEDEVQLIFWCVQTDGTSSESKAEGESGFASGVIVLSEDGSVADKIRRQTTIEVLEEDSELDVMVRMIEVVRTYDPDILTGYEVHGSSWGYLIERARFKYDYDLCDEFSRMKSDSHGRIGKENDRWGFNTTSTIRVTGRHMINIWRSMRGELNLLQYTLENVAWQVLRRRVPHYAWRTLTDWYQSGRPENLAKVLRYYTSRTRIDLEILEANELVPRTSEQARLLGVDFYSVFSRGSQFKVESIMFRIAKPENFVLVSPNRKQVGGQNALECLPLVMEPQSAFFNSPLLVLDFQSLYPSVMIAYNYCYSTFLGRVTSWRGTNKMGFTDFDRQPGLLKLLEDHINIAPNGMMYAKADIRKSLLAKMLTEILETRVMVKSGMKQDKEDRLLQQLLNNRQLALKLLANVTYGYTSASFSGRMPCSEIADSIVQTGRETLERAIAYIHSVERWGAEVVYGDTDSLFVYLPGRTRDEAFDLGNEIAKAVTDLNPRPVKLKFEKVYHPCVLLAKKRYVGYKYESREQVKPEFDAKGIETVRRDGTPAEQKMEEKALRILFETADLSQVKAYFQDQCAKVLAGAVSVQDFCFAREVRLGTYSDKGPLPPGALISTRRMLEDARAEPQYGERVPYVVVAGAPGARLIDRCVAPEELLEREGQMHLDAEYYITKNLIPPLERIFNLVGADVRRWYDEMPRPQLVQQIGDGDAGEEVAVEAGEARERLESYLDPSSCIVCGVRRAVADRDDGAEYCRDDDSEDEDEDDRGGDDEEAGNVGDSDFSGKSSDGSDDFGEDDGIPLCQTCREVGRVPETITTLQLRVQAAERKYSEALRVCRSCSGLSPLEEVACDSKDCPAFYSRLKQAVRVRTEREVVEQAMGSLMEELDKAELEW